MFMSVVGGRKGLENVLECWKQSQRVENGVVVLERVLEIRKRVLEMWECVYECCYGEKEYGQGVRVL